MARLAGLLLLILSHTTANALRHHHPLQRLRRCSHEHTRAAFVAAGVATSGLVLRQQPSLASEGAASVQSRSAASGAAAASSYAATRGGGDDGSGLASSTKTILYQPLSVSVDGIQVPVASWHPLDGASPGAGGGGTVASYEHRISVSKIGRLLAGWKLPSFIDRNFSLGPSWGAGSVSVVQASGGSSSGQQLQQSSSSAAAPVVLLAHGYLGSRFDLSHLAEALASEGFRVYACEYPESLAASYDPAESSSGVPIDRTAITEALLQALTEEWNLRPRAYGIVGHSLGCGTVDRTGDASWTRVCLAGGYPSVRGSNCLFVASVNDGAVSVGRALGALREYDFAALDEGSVRSKSWEKLPSRAALIFGDPSNAPNHISFLSEGTNDAMVEFLSPLLPVARALSIPVLDFDKYQTSRDSVATGKVVIPLVVDYLKQKMLF